ncbi:conserved hypothetical protein [Histoplasma mississippiense (nom. inval.)]|uniref:conserved hypothetical protein n=1 Tax=Ajellomyces capsulatus (strain NAm1 / WU24) TaxID=2059318 RepID=UPI000157CDB9|nr:conserved hypothetical protein [Histoplasma mississippiense (nom. inval.)]EDN10172.1 conserved hypothetical protein [Histoplasma mississippiense (nom. inval.)]
MKPQIHTLEDAPSGSAGCSKPAAPKLDEPETSSLIGRHLSPRTSEDSFRDEDASVSPGRDSLYADVRGWSMIPTVEFWQLFVLLGLFTRIGLMTIKRKRCGSTMTIVRIPNSSKNNR